MSISEEPSVEAIRSVPRTGVIYVMAEARRQGYSATDASWSNLGQGQPEIGDLPGAPARVRSMSILDDDQEYAPVSGLYELREAVADMYNALYRKGRGSRYSAENVAVSGGGRVGIMRACAAVGPVHVGHFLPDYTAYEELLDVFRRFTPIPILLDPEEGYAFSIGDLRHEILGRGLGALLLSNPCNPTGKVIAGDDLRGWVDTARSLDCALILDEFYSHYIWNQNKPTVVSAAEYVEDVDKDPVVIVDGLTKNWRYPGWRVSWTVGPKKVIEALASAGSFLDGGGSRPLQRAAVDMVNAEHALSETKAIYDVFGKKRQMMLNGLRELGVQFKHDPEGTFYCWGDVSGLPAGMNDGPSFFQRALKHKVIVVPGEFFDIDPGKRRHGRPSRFKHHVRFSFGPGLQTIEHALGQLRSMIRNPDP